MQQMHSGSDIAAADYAVVISFFAVMISVGFFFGKKQKNMAQFFGGGKQVPWWLSGISFYMCSFSALAFVMYSALAYKYGWLPITISWLSVPAVFFGCTFFAARWRRSAETSPLEFIERRYGNGMRQGLMWMGLPMRILDDSFKLLAIGTVVGAGMGFPIHVAITGSGLIILSYTFMGGLWATLVADFIQFFVLLAVIVILPFLCITKAGGWSEFISSVPEGFFNLTAGKYTWTYMIVFWLILFLNLSTSWSMVQRYYSTRSEKDARKVGYFVCVLLFIGPPLFFIPAMAARVFMPGLPESSMNEVYALICKNVLPVGLLGMVVAAMFSATMSTLAGDYNAVASVLTNDFYKRMIAPNSTASQQMVVARVMTVLVGVSVIGLTFVMRSAQGANDLFDTANKVFGIFLPPIAIPTLMGLTTRRVTRRGGVLGLTVGIATGLAAFVAGSQWPCLRQMEVIFTITALATLAALFVGSLLLKDDTAHDQKLTEFFKTVNTPSPVLESETARITFWPLVAGGLATISFVLVISALVTRPVAEVRFSLLTGAGLLVTATLFWIASKKGSK